MLSTLTIIYTTFHAVFSQYEVEEIVYINNYGTRATYTIEDDPTQKELSKGIYHLFTVDRAIPSPALAVGRTPTRLTPSSESRAASRSDPSVPGLDTTPPFGPRSTAPPPRLTAQALESLPMASPEFSPPLRSRINAGQRRDSASIAGQSSNGRSRLGGKSVLAQNQIRYRSADRKSVIIVSIRDTGTEWVMQPPIKAWNQPIIVNDPQKPHFIALSDYQLTKIHLEETKKNNHDLQSKLQEIISHRDELNDTLNDEIRRNNHLAMEDVFNKEMIARYNLSSIFTHILEDLGHDWHNQQLQLQWRMLEQSQYPIPVSESGLIMADAETQHVPVQDRDFVDAEIQANVMMVETQVQYDPDLELKLDIMNDTQFGTLMPFRHAHGSESETFMISGDLRKFIIFVGIIVLDLLLILICVCCVRVITRAKQKVMRATIHRKKRMELQQLDEILNREEAEAKMNSNGNPSERAGKKKEHHRSMQNKGGDAVENSQSFKNKLFFSIVEQEMIVKDIFEEVANENEDEDQDEDQVELQVHSPSLPVVKEESFEVHEDPDPLSIDFP